MNPAQQSSGIVRSWIRGVLWILHARAMCGQRGPCGCDSATINLMRATA
ncbi:MAG TPA: hypothetical protein VKU41_20175 [Polyangiaceae bacterium]|nr:hypothetical protein [Polyangiaceae bacterium]